mgnify:FL=1
MTMDKDPNKISNKVYQYKNGIFDIASVWKVYFGVIGIRNKYSFKGNRKDLFQFDWEIMSWDIVNSYNIINIVIYGKGDMTIWIRL